MITLCEDYNVCVCVIDTDTDGGPGYNVVGHCWLCMQRLREREFLSVK